MMALTLASRHRTPSLFALLLTTFALVACDSGGGGGGDTGTDLGTDIAADSDGAGGDTVAETGTVAGTVSLSDGGDPSGAVVTATAPDDGTETVTVDATGAFELSGLFPGSWTVSATLDGYTEASSTAEVVAGEVVTVDLVLDPAANSPPTITSLMLDPAELSRGGMGVATAEVTDPDDDTFTWSWEADGGFSATPSAQAENAAIVTAPDMAGASGTLTLTVTDSAGNSATDTLTLTTSENQAPVIDALEASPDATVDPGVQIGLTVTATDPEGGALTYTWAVDDEAWTLTPTDATATADAPNAFGATADVTVTVTDDAGGMAQQTLSLSTTPCADTTLIDCDGDASNGCEAPDSGIGPRCPATTCRTALAAGSTADGVHWVTLGGAEAFATWCDMTTDGGGWTLLGTVSGADQDQWNERFGFWADTNVLGDAGSPRLDFKSRAWFEMDLTDATILYQRHFDGAVRGNVMLGNACLGGNTRFLDVFGLYDTSVACGPADMEVVSSDPAGVRDADHQEGALKGLGSTSTNGLCWATQDTAVDVFSGHIGWNADPSATDCAQSTHLGGIGVFENDFSGIENADITETGWLLGTDPTLTAISFFAREPLTVVGAADASDPGRWSDGSFARSCDGYRHPDAFNAIWDGPGDGIYTIDVDGPQGPEMPRDVTCDMTTDGGGWTRVHMWDRENDGDTIADLTTVFQTTFNNMTQFEEKMTFVRWSDADSTADALAMRAAIDVPNSGDVAADMHYEGLSLDGVGVWFFATSGNSETDLFCWDDQGFAAFSGAELAQVPSYNCSTPLSPKTFVIDERRTATAPGPIDGFNIHSLMHDCCVDGGDSSDLYRIEVWVR